MGYIYEELLRRFSEQSGEEAGEHFTPRESSGLWLSCSRYRFLSAPVDLRPGLRNRRMLSVTEEHLLDRAITPPKSSAWTST